MLLHAALLATPLQQGRSGGDAPRPAPSLVVDFATRIATGVPAAPHDPTTAESASPVPGGTPDSRTHGRRRPSPAVPVEGTANAEDIPPPAQAVDLDAARALAREIGRDTRALPPGNSRPATSPPAAADALALAIANAYRRGAPVERRENGGWVIRDGKRRCLIAPRDVPLFLQGVLIVPVCEF